MFVCLKYAELLHTFTKPFFTGAKAFAIWTLPQIQYKNPNVQITTFLNQTPSPYITCYLDGGTKVLFDVDGQTKEEIIERIYKTLGKSKKKLQAEELAAQKKDNPANFGRHNDRYCLCSEPGQVPCPSFIPLPKVWRGKFVNENMED